MGKRGPARDTETDQRILEIVAQLEAWDFHAGHAQVAAVLSFERSDAVTAETVRNRRRRL